MNVDVAENKRVSYGKSREELSVESSSLISTTSTISVCPSELYDWKALAVSREQKQRIISSNWGGYALDLNLWQDTQSPVVRTRSSKVSLDNRECCGVLSDRLIGIGSSFLSKSPENSLYVLSKCVLRNRNLTDIAMLRYHRYLQYLDVANNSISCFSTLGHLPYLMYLNAAHNKIARPLKFTPSSWYLTYVNLSYNHLSDVGDLRHCWSIVRLNLSHNVIETISGLENLRHLQYLDLSYNLIECIENLDGLNLQELNLEGNCITSFRSITPIRGVNVLSNLQTMFLGYNRLSNLGFLKDAYNLHFVDLKFNKISDLLEVLNLKSLIYEIDLRGNACTKWPNYRNVLISSIPSVKFIDSTEVFVEEKITSTALFSPSLDLIVARNVAKLTLLEQLNITKIDAHVQPYDEISPPLIILTGPSAVRKMPLALHVTRTIPDKIKYCRWHTTKGKYENEDERSTYISVNREEFNNIARQGKFLVILDLLGHSYGFHVDEIVPLIYEKKIGLTQSNLYAATEISKRYPNVRAILMLTQCVELHRTWIKEKFDIYTWIRDSVENLLVVQIGKHIEDENIAESTSSILNFIEEILDEVIECLQLPSYSIWIRPQGTGATATDIILESKTMLPKVVMKRSEAESGMKKRITFQDEERKKNDIVKSFEQLLSEEKYAHTIEGLKVILDEQSNIIIDDEETKRELRRTKILHRRSTLESSIVINDDNFDDDFSESTSTDDEVHQKRSMNEERGKALKNMYVELIIKTRKLYLDYHESHPGFFALVLLMDDYTNAFDSLIDFIQKSDISQSYRKPTFLSEVNRLRQTASPIILENIIDEMKENLSISKLQRRMIFKTHGLVRNPSKKNVDDSVSSIYDN